MVSNKPNGDESSNSTESRRTTTIKKQHNPNDDDKIVPKKMLKMFDTQTIHNSGTPFWIVDGEAYDLSEFMKVHPGGAIWFKWNVRRDISILFHTYHVNPKKLLPILKKYKITNKTHPHCYQECSVENLLPQLGIPPFLLPESFDARRDLHTFDFSDDNKLLATLQKHMQAVQEQIQSCNTWWDRCCYVAILLYIMNSVAFFGQFLPTWITVTMYIVLRTSFGAFGHYYLHAKKPHVLEVLFDANYVGTSFVAFDGHVMLHHTYTHTGADVKTTFFSGMWTLPPFYRPIGYTLHKLGSVLSGVFLRCLEVISMEFDAKDVSLSFWSFRFLLWSEFILVMTTHSLFVPFMIQFVITLWFNTILVLSSHDFEDFYSDPLGGYHPDWAIFQIQNCHDMTLFGNKYMDMFLSAGLSSHRAHHLLPYQPSGFANLASEPIIAKLLPDYGLEWHPPRNFWTERAPYVFSFCFLHPTIGMEDVSLLQQHFSLTGIVNTIQFISTGFIGINSV